MTDQCRYALVVQVFHLVAPHAVHGIAGFQRDQGGYGLSAKPSLIFPRQVIFENLEVFAFHDGPMVVVGHQAVRIDPMDEIIEFAHPPLERNGIGLMVPLSVEPERLGMILFHEFPDLALLELEIGIIIGLGRVLVDAGMPLGVVRTDPVDEGIIVMHPHSLRSHGLRQFPKDVPPERGGIHDVERALGRPVHGKAVMMAGGQGHIAGPGFLEGPGPFGRIETAGVEPAGRLAVHIGIQLPVGEVPLPLRIGSVDSPMEEYSETLTGEFLPGGKVLGRRLVILWICLERELLPGFQIALRRNIRPLGPRLEGGTERCQCDQRRNE